MQKETNNLSFIFLKLNSGQMQKQQEILVR